MNPRTRVLASALALGLFASCFDPPVRETWSLSFLCDGPVVASRTAVFSEKQNGPAIERRVAEARAAILEGRDEWSLRVAALAPPAFADRSERRRIEGRLERAIDQILLEDPERLSEFFSGLPIAVDYRANDVIAELSIAPGAPAGLPRKEREATTRALREWADQGAAYLTAGNALWEYLETRPDRAEACFRHLFERTEDSNAPPRPELEENEKKLVEALEEAMLAVAEALRIPDGQDRSLDENIRRLYDPFPAPIDVRLPTRGDEVIGFLTRGDAAKPTLATREHNLWSAFGRLEGRWLAPDPALAFVRASLERSGTKPFSPTAFASARRFRAEEPPSGQEILAALATELRSPPLYRVTWKREPAECVGKVTSIDEVWK